MQQTVAVIGTGRMGSALATALVTHGYRTRVWNRTPARYAALAAQGARPAASVAEAASDAGVVIVNVSDSAASKAILDAAEVRRALAGKLLVQLTSGSPRQARASAAWAAAHGIDYLDGAIMATPNYIGTPDGTILYAGPADQFDAHRPVFLALGGNARHVGGDVGHAAALDAALLGQMWGALFGALLGAVIAEAEGIAHALFMTHFAAFKPVVDDAVVDAATRVRDGRLEGDAATLASLDAHYGAFRQLRALCRERAIDPTLPEAFDQLFGRALAAGRAADDFAALSAFMRQPAALAGAGGER